MRLETTARYRHGFFHEAALYDSDDGFLAIIIPFLTDGIEVGEPTMVVVDEGNAELIRTTLGDTSDISFTDARVRYTRPASVIKAYRRTLAEHVARGARQIRLVGEIPHPGPDRPWEWWARYEAAVNHAFAEFPAWTICAYDARIVPTEMLADVARTHPHVVTADGRHVASPSFEDPAEFLIRRPVGEADPLESTPPMIDLVDPALPAARRAVRNASRASRLDDAEVADFVWAVNEAVANGISHGHPPVRLRVWSDADRMVVTVTDQGHGPADPLAGLLPKADTSASGLGLWLTHQICSYVTHGRDNDGFTIRLVAGVPSLTP